MFSAADFRAIVSGERKDLAAGLWRGLFWLAEGPYALAMSARNWAFDRGWFEQQRVRVPVISVGNLTLGGTGKTPLVAWIARWLRARAWRASIISRGYGAADGAANDEYRELEQQLPDVPHLQDADRFAAAQVAIDELATQIILLDDGFQHRQLARDLNLVLLDATEPFGWGHVFPRGALREPLAALGRACLIGLSRADLLSPDQRRAVRDQARAYAPQAEWLELAHAPRELLACDGRTETLDLLRGAKVAAFCGLGNPAGFRSTLAQCGCDVQAWREFPDHHPYSRDDVQSLAEWAAASDASFLICTHKDLVKLDAARLGGKPLWALAIGIEFLAGQEVLERRLEELVARIAPDDA